MRVFLAGLALSFIVAAQAAQAAAELTADAVLASSARHYPQILESLAERRAAEGAALSALGAFDVVFSADASSRVSGFYDGRVIETKISRNLRSLGASVYGGYKLSDGGFPIYEDANFTNAGGEAKIGLLFSLLRDRAIDERRFSAAAAALDLERADLDVLLTQIGVQHRALSAYWRWLAAGNALQTYEELLDIARKRQTALEQQVRLGARAKIFLTENQQNITRREILATAAARDFQSAANDLSMFFRDVTGARLTPGENQLPRGGVLSDFGHFGGLLEEDPSKAALMRRPELRMLAVQAEKARQTLALRRNQLMPRLDFRYEVSRDFGDTAEGGVSRDSTDNIVGLRFTVPFERRGARGSVRKVEAELEALKERKRQLEDQINVEVTNILLDLETNRSLSLLASREASQANIMQQAERERFASGASDFFLVNLREEAAASARIRQVSASLSAQLAAADFSAATVNFEALGLHGTE